MIEGVIALSIAELHDFDVLACIIMSLNSFPQKTLCLQPSILDLSPLFTSVFLSTSKRTWEGLHALERVLSAPLFLGREVSVLNCNMGAIYKKKMARYVIRLLARFRFVDQVTFGVLEWFDTDTEPAGSSTSQGDSTPQGSSTSPGSRTSSDTDSETSSTSTGPDTQETLVDTEEAQSCDLSGEATEEPEIMPLPKILLWSSAKMDFPLTGASTLLSLGCWPRMRRLTLNVAVPNASPDETELDIAQVLAHTLSRVSFLFPSLETLRLSTTIMPCEAARRNRVSSKEGNTATPIDPGTPITPAAYRAAIISLGSKALVPPLAFLTKLEVRAIPKAFLLTFASQWTCRAKEHNIQLSLRSGGWVVEGEEDEYGEWANFSDEFARRAEIARENDMEMTWDKNCYGSRLMTGKTEEKLAEVAQAVRIKVTVKE